MAIGDKKPVVMESDRAVPSGIATLDASGNVPFEQLGNVVRPNLLINYDFRNPVNQRGKDTYTGNIYSLDRWMMSSVTSHGTLHLLDDGIRLVHADDGGYTNLWQSFDTEITGTVTASAIIDGKLYTKTGKMGGLHTGLTDGVEVLSTSTRNFALRFYAPAAEKTVQAVKLELGSTQTLAHQDADGNWVLNEIPGYGEELWKCQRSQVDINGLYPMVQTFGGNGYWFAVQLPRELRATPTVDLSAAKILTSGTFITVGGSYALHTMRGRTLIIQFIPTTATTLTNPVLSLPVRTIADANM